MIYRVYFGYIYKLSKLTYSLSTTDKFEKRVDGLGTSHILQFFLPSSERFLISVSSKISRIRNSSDFNCKERFSGAINPLANDFQFGAAKNVGAPTDVLPL